MRIHAIFCWYDESPSWIGTAITSLSRFCDHIVALDGAYALYPGGKARSHPQQAEVILHTAEAMETAVTIYQPSEVWWGNELGKRNKAFDIVAAYAEEGDWLCTYDADYHVVKCNPSALRADLERSECDVCTYGLVDGEDWLALENPLATEAKLQTQWVSQTRDLYRWHPTLRVGPAHGDYSDERYGKKRWLRGPYGNLEPADDMSQWLTVYHRTKDRALVRSEAQQGYYRMRDSLGIEDQTEALKA